MAFSTRVATMPHVVAVPECSSGDRDAAGENNRKRLLVALELRHRALTCGARHHRLPTRTIPFPLSNRTALPPPGEEFARPGIRVAHGWSAQSLDDFEAGKDYPTCFPEVLECA